MVRAYARTPRKPKIRVRETSKFSVSQRQACRVLGQHRSTQGKTPKGRADDAALTADIVALATEYGRYNHRRITARLRAAGWVVNVKRVERRGHVRPWFEDTGRAAPGEAQGAREAAKQGRIWLNDGSCVRLQAERPNHV